MILRLGLVLLGVYVALIGAVVHRHTTEVGGVHWPWGLALALVATVAVALAAGRIGQVGEAWYALGWTVVLIVQSVAPGGSFLVANDWFGWVYSSLGMGSLGVVIVRSSRLDR
ncbi:MAG: hypothetical protein ACR2FE_12435 [Aeromicrobium sp.]